MNHDATVNGSRLRHGQEMAVNRLAFSVLFAIYLAVAGARHGSLIVFAAFAGFSCAAFAWLRRGPVRTLDATLVCALVADLGLPSFGMHIDGPRNAAFFPMYLWVIQGNGFRFGLKPLFLGMGLAFAGFAAVVVSTPYWYHQPGLCLGGLAALIFLPIYNSSLIRKLSRARLQAEEANQAKSLFLAAISHELRTPLNAIFGSLSLLEGTPLDEEQHSLFDAMRSGTRALLSLIGSVLDFSRAEAGLMPVQHEPLDLAGLVAEIRNLVAIQARLKSLQLRVHVGEDVPLRILGDRKHLFEILLNFAANAVKFTEAGSVCLSVERLAPVASSQSPRLRFEVSDTGIGIALDAQQRIFEVFSQADASILDRFGGTGLGLAISQQLVTLMQGEIGVESQPGQGSRFWFTLKLEAAPPEVALPDEATGHVPSPAPRAGMLLCDDPAQIGAIEDQLRRGGFTIRHVAGPQDALGSSAARPGEEMLFIHRRNPGDDLLADCALLDRLDPQAAMPRILLSHANGTILPRAMLKQNFITTLTLPASDKALAQAWHLASAMTARPGTRPAHGMPGAALPGEGLPGDGVSGGIRGAQRQLQILVADDNEINRRVVGKILERSGHQVCLVEDGNQALDLMEAQPFDIVLMDINMPRMNGMEATRLFRLGGPASPHLPIVALTADATAEMARKCTEVGMDGCITKPFTPAHLMATIDALVGTDTRPAAHGSPVQQIADHPRFVARFPTLDIEVLAELRRLGGPEFVSGLLHSFIMDVHELIGRIGAAVEAQDMTAFRFEMHALCSGAANIGAESLRRGAVSREINQANLASAGPVLMHWLRQELAALEREWNRLEPQQAELSG